ncbi:MAG: MFS transporter [Candidatus Dormibacteria bacterium]
MPVSRRLPGIVSERRFLLFAGGQGVSAIGDGVYLVALAWTSLQLTHSPVYLGLLLTTSALPRAILLLAGGVLVDRLGARRVILGSDLSRALLIGGVAAVVLLGHLSILLLFLIAAIFGVFDAVFYPATMTLVPALVGPEQLSAANGVWQLAVEGTMIVGPPLGGLVVGLAGPGPAFLVDAVSFLVAFGALLAVRVTTAPSSSSPPTASGWSSLTAGVRTSLGNPLLRALMPLTAVLNLAAGGPLNVGIPLLARGHGWGPAGYGLIEGGLGAGILVGGAAMGAGLRLPRPGLSVLGMAAALGVLTVLLGEVRVLPLAMVLALVMGALISATNVAVVSLVQQQTPAEVLGRVMSVLMFSSMSLTPVSYAVSGGVARGIGVSGLFAAGGLLVVVTAAVGYRARAVREFGLAEPSTV